MLSGLLRQCCGLWTRGVFNNCGSQLDLVVQAPATEMTSHRLWKAYKMLSPTQVIVLASSGGIAAGTVVYALTAATDPEQRLARAREEMMRIPRLRRADEDAISEARARTRRVQQMVEASKTASTTERLETVARATEAFYRGDDDRPK